MSKKTQNQTKLHEMALLLNPPRINDDEKKSLELYFGTDANTYKALRDCFFGFELTEDEKLTLKNIGANDLLRRIFLPEVKKEIPLGQNYDLWQTQDMKSAASAEIELFIKAKQTMLEMLEKSLARLADPNLEGVDLTVKPDHAFILARNGYISYVDQQIRFIIQFVNMGKLSEAEQLEMIRRNSAK